MGRNITIFLAVVGLGVLAMLGYKFGAPYWKGHQQTETSDAKDLKGTLRVGKDSWIGYYPLCSRNFRQKMRGNGYLIKCVDDAANYKQRFKSLAAQELEFAVATVDSYLANGKASGFPGTIVAIIDESKGGDAIIARTDKASSLDKIKNLSSARIAFTADSPSEFLLQAAAVHFDVQNFRKGKAHITRLESLGAEDAYKQLMADKADIAVLWEPYVTKALSQNKFTKILSSADTARLIVDVLVVNRDYGAKHPDVVNIVLRNYFRTLKYYRDNPAELREELQQDSNLSAAEVQAMLAGVSWQTLSSNAKNWFGIAKEGELSSEDLIETIDAAMEILKDAKTLDRNPLPDENPYIILNKDFIKNLAQSGIAESNETASKVEFKALSPEQWEQLQEVGTLRVRPITFQSGTNELSQDGKQELSKMLTNIKHYPNFRIVVKGHTGLGGQGDANKLLSQQRAEEVRTYLTQSLQLEENRIHAVGLGSEKPLPRLPDESDRAYNYRLPRVELSLVSDVY